MPGRQQRRGRRPRRDPVPDRSRLGRSAQGRLAAHHVRRPAGGRQLHGHHGLLPFGNQHARDPAARCAGEGAVSAEPVGPGGRRIGTESAEEGHERAAPLAARSPQGQGHRQRGAARGAHHRVPRHPDVGRRLHQRPVQRRADVRARRGDSQEQGPAHVSGAARPRVGGAQDQEVRSGAAARRPDGPIRSSRCFRDVACRRCQEYHVETGSVHHVSARVTGSACFAFRARRRSRSS